MTVKKVLAAAVMVMMAAMTSPAYALNGTGVVDGTNGANADAFAFGRFLDAGATLGNWTLGSSVSNTDYANDGITGGTSGLQYVSLNETHGSTDVNVIDFVVTPNAGYTVDQISIIQSPYFDTPGTWNGGNAETAQFTLSWTGGGTAQVLDPSNQFAGSNGATTVTSGSLLTFSSDRIFNDSDAWEILLPAGVSDVQLDWSSVNPGPNTDLTREWVTFDSSFSTVPEPSSFGLLAFAMLSAAGLRRRRG